MEKLLKCYEEAIEVADGSHSYHSAATMRIAMARSLGYWTRTLPDLKSTVHGHLKWVVQNTENRLSNEMVEEATKLETLLSSDGTEPEPVMNVARGYDYGGDASDDWYQCPYGHDCFMGECEAMNIPLCVECGQEVGGATKKASPINNGEDVNVPPAGKTIGWRFNHSSKVAWYVR